MTLTTSIPLEQRVEITLLKVEDRMATSKKKNMANVDGSSEQAG